VSTLSLRFAAPEILELYWCRTATPSSTVRGFFVEFAVSMKMRVSQLLRVVSIGDDGADTATCFL
jgi:hypothetical protein